LVYDKWHQESGLRDVLGMQSEIQGSLKKFICLGLGTLGSFMFGSWTGIGRPEIQRIPCELAWGLFSAIVGNWSRE